MKKLFLLVFASLLLLLSFIPSAFAEDNSLSAEEEYELIEASATTIQASEDSSSPLERAKSNTSEEEISESPEGSLPEDLLTADCTTFYTAEDIVKIEEEVLYKKQSALLMNLEFAKQSNFRLDPSDQTLSELNQSFLQSNFVQERIAALDALRAKYSDSVTNCLESQARAVEEKTLAELEERKAARLSEIEETAKEALAKLAERVEIRRAEIERKQAKRLAKIKKEGQTTHKNFKKQVNKAYNQVYSGKKPSIYNKTIITFEQKLDQLPAFIKAREQEVIALSNKALTRSEKSAARAEEKINQKKEEKTKDLEKDIDQKAKAANNLLEKTLTEVPDKVTAKADSIYSARREAVAGEGAIIEERVTQGNTIINYLKELWVRDRKKDLPRLDITSLDLDSAEVTVKGIIDPKVAKESRQAARQQAKKEGREVTRDRSGKKKPSGGLNANKPNKGKGKNKPNKDKDGSGDFVGNIDRIWKEHNSANGDWGGPTLPSYVVAALAEAAGMPGVTMEQVTRGESGAHKKNSARPGATGVDPGGTKGYGLWMITTSFNDDLAKKVGGYKKFLNPVLNAWAAAQIYKRNGLGAWYGTRSVQGDGINYKGKYDLRKALGGRTYKQVLASYGIGKK